MITFPYVPPEHSVAQYNLLSDLHGVHSPEGLKSWINEHPMFFYRNARRICGYSNLGGTKGKFRLSVDQLDIEHTEELRVNLNESWRFEFVSGWEGIIKFKAVRIKRALIDYIFNDTGINASTIQMTGHRTYFARIRLLDSEWPRMAIYAKLLGV